jgi:hypothetical protein
MPASSRAARAGYQKSSLEAPASISSGKRPWLKLEVGPRVDEEFLRVEISANKDSVRRDQAESNGEFP